MASFDGIPEGKSHQIQIPEKLFQQLFPQIDHLGELKLTLHCFYLFDHMDGAFRYLRRADLLKEEQLLIGLAETSGKAEAALDDALDRAVQRGTFLMAKLEFDGVPEPCYFLNSPRGRAAIRAIQSGQWQLSDPTFPGQNSIRPTIYQLYEENIGPLSPLIADALSDAQDRFSASWIEEAFRIAAEKNKRNWRYVLAILERWQREGKYDRQEKSEDRRDTPEARRRYVEGEFSDHIEH
jgi:DNA replication protein